MPNLKLAVISDLHIGETARSKDLSPYQTGPLTDENYLGRFEKFVRDQSLRADFLIVPGDVTNRATTEEFELASNLILRVANAFNLTEEKILFVPGNHDKNWSIQPTGDIQVDLDLMYQNIRRDDLIFQRIFERSSYKCPNSKWSIWEYDNFLVVGYNSAWHDGANARPHHGLVEAEALAEIEVQLRQLDTTQSKLKLLLIHHHPIGYSNPIPELPDFSVMTNAENLLRMVSRFRFDLIIHGHRHMPHFSPHLNNNNHPIVILGAGSFSYQLDHTYQGHAGNLFHILEINCRDVDTQTILGKVNSWAYLSGHGWGPSNPSTGIHHCVGFGSYTNPNVLKSHIRPMVIEEKNRINYVQWKKIVEIDQKLAYLNPECIMDVFGELAVELGMTRWGNGPDDLLLLET